MQFEHRQAQTSDYEMKKKSGQVAGYNEMMFKLFVTEQNDEKVERFKKRLSEFTKIATLEEAKELATKIMPVKSERTVFNIGNAKCIVINKKELLKITLKTTKEYINYCFV